MSLDSADTFRPTATWQNLRRRAELLRRLRDFFDRRGFLEVETPILSADTVVDRHLDPFSIISSPLPLGEGPGVRAGGSCEAASGLWEHAEQAPPLHFPLPTSHFPLSPSPALWLQTSPEFAMKRLLAAGAGPIYQVARVFRLDELGPLHNPEFTLVEWYRPGDDLDAGMQLTSDLCEALLSSRHTPCAERLTYCEAFERYIGIDPHAADGAALMAIAKKLGVEAPASLSVEDRDGWLDLLMVERIQPHLGVERPTLLYDYPASQAALARVRREPGKPPVAERFELYINGVELANGYHELLDPAELRARNAAVNRQRLFDGKPALPEESRLLQAMEFGLPSSVGVALGFDRLVMAALGVPNIADAIAFPFDRA